MDVDDRGEEMIDNTESDSDDPASYYVGEVESSLHACRHYLDKVTQAQTSDVHERARHSLNLRSRRTKTKAWLASGQTDKVEEWRKVRRLTEDTAYLIGLAAVWLQEIVWQRPSKNA